MPGSQRTCGPVLDASDGPADVADGVGASADAVGLGSPAVPSLVEHCWIPKKSAMSAPAVPAMALTASQDIRRA
jgi:hypothetical protein